MPVTVSRRAIMAATSALLTLPPLTRAKAAKPTLRVGLLTDMSGPSAGITGLGSAVAVKLAVQDFQASHPGFGADIDVVVADFQSKSDIALSIAHSWIEQKSVDVIVGLPLSAAALGTITLLQQFDKVGLLTESGASVLTGSSCGPNHIQWTYDTYSVCKPTVDVLVPAGGDSWFFLTSDFTLGHQLADDATKFIEKDGGKVLGQALFPYSNSDFSSHLLMAQTSKAKVIGLAAPGDAATQCIKQAEEFGIVRGGQKLALLIAMINNIHAVGLKSAQELYITEAFYWDMNDGTRAFSKRFAAEAAGAMPNMCQAGDYSAVLHYLNTVAAMGIESAKGSGRAAVAAMKTTAINDPLFGPCQIRADGMNVHDMHLFQVKSPQESKYPWDYYKLVKTVSGGNATRLLSDGDCPMVKS